MACSLSVRLRSASEPRGAASSAPPRQDKAALRASLTPRRAARHLTPLGEAGGSWSSPGHAITMSLLLRERGDGDEGSQKTGVVLADGRAGSGGSAVTAVPGKASTVERSGTITCTFNPQSPTPPTAASGSDGLRRDALLDYLERRTSCTSGTLILWGIGHFDTLTYFYTGRAVSPKLDGTTVSSSGSTPKTPPTWRRFSFPARG